MYRVVVRGKGNPVAECQLSMHWLKRRDKPLSTEVLQVYDEETMQALAHELPVRIFVMQLGSRHVIASKFVVICTRLQTALCKLRLRYRT